MFFNYLLYFSPIYDDFSSLIRWLANKQTLFDHSISPLFIPLIPFSKMPDSSQNEISIMQLVRS
ncbi:hypothetical protein ExPEC_3569 [Escherichia coli]|nr:hypothetical protein ExPEC_3569 [Escherichia coli]